MLNLVKSREFDDGISIGVPRMLKKLKGRHRIAAAKCLEINQKPNEMTKNLGPRNPNLGLIH